MRVALLVGSFPIGSNTTYLGQISGLVDRGHEVDIYADSGQPAGEAHPEVARHDFLSRTRYTSLIPKAIPGRSLAVLRLLAGRPAPERRMLYGALNPFRFGHAATSTQLLHQAVPFLPGRRYDVVFGAFGTDGIRAADLETMGVLEGAIATGFRGHDLSRYIRRRGAAILRRLRAISAKDWHRAVIDIPKRRHKNIRYLDETVRLRDYGGSLRQVVVSGLGREEPTLCLSNNTEVTAREVVTRYVGRNGVEDSLGISVNFFHLDCLASEVRLNVDLDVALTVIAHGCYRWLASRLRGFDKAKPKQLYRRFVETGGVIEVQAERLVVHFDKRCHNPILREAALDQDNASIAWLRNRPLTFDYP